MDGALKRDQKLNPQNTQKKTNKLIRFYLYYTCFADYFLFYFWPYTILCRSKLWAIKPSEIVFSQLYSNSQYLITVSMHVKTPDQPTPHSWHSVLWIHPYDHVQKYWRYTFWQTLVSRQTSIQQPGAPGLHCSPSPRYGETAPVIKRYIPAN